jgi:hypothetical protein
MLYCNPASTFEAIDRSVTRNPLIYYLTNIWLTNVSRVVSMTLMTLVAASYAR